MSNLPSFSLRFVVVSDFSSPGIWTRHKGWACSFETRTASHRRLLGTALAAAFFLFLAGSGRVQAQTATVNWTNQHQVIDGFGASNVFYSAPMSSANQQFFFGTGSGQIGLSLLRVGITNTADSGGSFSNTCLAVSAQCAGPVLSDMQACVSNGCRVYATAFSPPPSYTTNGSTVCSANGGDGQLATSHYADFATWLSNFTLSVPANTSSPQVHIYAMSLQNEPNGCWSSDSTEYSASQLDTFIKNNLGPTLAANGSGTLLLAPETNVFSDFQSWGNTCATDSSCAQYLAGFNSHDYDANVGSGYSVTPDPYPGGWPSGKKYWMTEASCFLNGSTPEGPNFCPSGVNPGIPEALNWAAVIDQRMQDGFQTYLYWELIAKNADDEGLIDSDGTTITSRAWVFGQYSKFVRPGYYRIDATHTPQSGVTVSAFQNKSTNTLVIIATNYTGSAVSQTFNLTNAPTFSTMTPTTTSASLHLATQSNLSVSGNSFTYTLPANSVTTFVSSGSAPPAPTNLSGTVVQ